MTPLIRFVLAWVSGMALAQAFDFRPVWLLAALPPALALLVGWRDHRWARVAGAAMLAFSLGGLRLAAAEPRMTPAHVAYYRGAGEVGVVGVIIADPDRRSQDTRLRLRAEQVIRQDGSAYDVRGRLLVYSPPTRRLNTEIAFASPDTWKLRPSSPTSPTATTSPERASMRCCGARASKSLRSTRQTQFWTTCCGSDSVRTPACSLCCPMTPAPCWRAFCWA